MDANTFFSILIGIGLAASVGFRIFVPLFVLSIATYYQVIPLNENWEWVGSSTAIIILGIATVVEVIAYLVPWLDNALDSLAIPLAAVAGTAVMVATVSDLNPAITWALAIIAGGGTATAIQTSTSVARLASSTTTAGFANPILSTVETGSSILVALLAIVYPIAAILLILLIVWLLFRIFKKFRKKSSS